MQHIVLFPAEAVAQIEAQTCQGKHHSQKSSSHASHRETSEELSAGQLVCLPGHRSCCCLRNLVHPKIRTPFGYFPFSKGPGCISNSKQLHPKPIQGRVQNQASPGSPEDAEIGDFTHWDSRSISSTCIDVECE